MPDFVLNLAAEKEVKELLLGILDTKATGTGGIPLRSLKANLEVVVLLLTHIIL